MILKRPILTEKSRKLAKMGQYVFEVRKNATKSEIKKAIEENFKVNVLEVRIVKIPPKQRNFRGFTGWKKGYKKAIIKVRKGQKIAIFE